MLFQDYDNVFLIGQAIVAILLLANGIYLLLLARKSEIPSQRQVFMGTSLFLLTCMVLELGYIIDLYFRNFKVPPVDVFPKFADIGGPGYMYLMLVIFAFGSIPLMFPLEKVLLNSKSMWRTKLAVIGFLILLIPVVGIILIPEIETRTLITYVGLPFFAFSIILSVGGNIFFYIRLGVKSPGYVRKKSWSIGFGILVTIIAIVLAFFLKGTDILSNFVSPAVLCIGLWLLLRGEQMKINS
jgi:hypothetical protein